MMGHPRSLSAGLQYCYVTFYYRLSLFDWCDTEQRDCSRLDGKTKDVSEVM